ncbi:MAG: PhzF family phenazine biosynthesis isomerase [Pseudomonadota bacterium]
MAVSFPFSLYDCFSSAPFGGSQAAIIEVPRPLEPDLMQTIALETAMPVTVFLSSVSGRNVNARFFSAVMEQPMCGHGAVGLFTHLSSEGRLTGGSGSFHLHMPNVATTVEVAEPARHQPLVMLDVKAPDFAPPGVDLDTVCALLGLDRGDLSNRLNPVRGKADFIHLILPLAGPGELASIAPEFDKLGRFCRAHGIDTVCAFCMDDQEGGTGLHVRDFCPAVGVAESSSAGTTNAVIAAYLYDRALRREGACGSVEIMARQGTETGRPSRLRTVLTLKDRRIVRVQIGGTASRLLTGHINVPGCLE